MSTFTSAELKIITLARQSSTLQTDLGNNPMRLYNRQIMQNEIGRLLTAGACVTITRSSTTPEVNQGGVMPLRAIRFRIDVYGFDSEPCRTVAQHFIEFMGTIDLCSNSQFNSPITTPPQNPCFLENQVARMRPNPTQDAGPIYVESLVFKVWNNESLSIAA